MQEQSDEDESYEMFKKHLGRHIKKYTDFDRKVEMEVSAFDYYWDTHTFDFVSHLNSKLADKLSDEFKYAFEMTK